MTEPTDAEIVALADATRTAEGGANGYILPISFARAVLAKWGTLRNEKIVIPTDTMEQEFQKHYQRGYAAGQKASATQPTKAQAIQGVQWQCGTQANGFTAPQADSQPAPVRDEELAELLDLLTNKTAFPTYYFNHKSLYECCDCASEHEDYAEIEHADTCASNKAFADRKKIAELIATLRNRAASAPADSVLEDADPIRALIAEHAAILDQNESAYFELCYHRATGWMAWITDKPLCMPPVVNPDRKVLAQGQGDTADEACRDAARKQGANHD